MKSDDSLGPQLNKPRPPAMLEQQLRHNWQRQKCQTPAPKRSLLLTRVAAAVLLLFIGYELFNTTPDLVVHAKEDILRDRLKPVGLSIPPATIESTQAVALGEINLPLKMTKRCTLDGETWLHLLLADGQEDEVHVFLRKDEAGFKLRATQAGTSEELSWRLVHRADGLTALIVTASQTKPEHIDRLMRTMLYT